MKREVIRPDFPYTEDEVAAGWIWIGFTTEDAAEAAHLFACALTSDFKQLLTDEEGADGGMPVSGVSFVGGLDAAIAILADIRANGELLSARARDGMMLRLPPRPMPEDVEGVLESMAGLGPSWASVRGNLRALLLDRTD